METGRGGAAAATRSVKAGPKGRQNVDRMFRNAPLYTQRTFGPRPGYRFAEVPATSPESEVTRLMATVKPDVVVAAAATAPRVPEAHASSVVRLDALGDESLTEAAETGEEGAFCVLTSGTTALSKIVVCPHAAVTACAAYMRDDGVGPGDAVGLFWLAWYMVPPMLAGARVHVLDDKAFVNPRALVDAVRRPSGNRNVSARFKRTTPACQ